MAEVLHRCLPWFPYFFLKLLTPGISKNRGFFTTPILPPQTAKPDFGYSFGDRVKFLHITPEPKPVSVGIVALKGRLGPAAAKFWQCAKEASSRD
jgi:hypothetical protein